MPDGSGVVVHLEKRCYYPLSRSGVLLWHLFDDGKAVSEDALVGALVARYRINAATAQRDVHVFVKRLVDEGILVDA